MNVLTAPKFLRRGEPAAPALPALRPEEMRQTTMEFMNSVDRQREENAYLHSENENLRVDNKALREQVRMLEHELNFVRNERDQIGHHDSMMMGGLGAIKAAINDLFAKSRDAAFAPPGSGTEDHTPKGDELAAEVTKLAATVTPEQKNDAQS